MKWHLMILLVAMAALVTGCPREEYTVELTPQGDVIERKLTFFQADGYDASGAPNYQAISTNDLAGVARVYPPGALKEQGDWVRVATGRFSGAMPADIGGAGSYTCYSNGLGSAGFYLERFRGNDDLATNTVQRLKAADRLTDLMLGWSRAELGREPRYNNLRTFLDTDFRKDVQNLGLYWWQSCVTAPKGTNNLDEFAARFGLYVVERGYLKLADLPDLFRAVAANDKQIPAKWVQRLVALKLGLPMNGPTPKSLAFLADNDAMRASWERYLATTDEYKQRLWKWQRQNFAAGYLNWGGLKRQIGGIFRARSTNAPAAPAKPDPAAIGDELLEQIFMGRVSENNLLTVMLALPAAPLHTNGKWDEAAHKVRWESNLANTAGSESEPAVFCFAAWSQADEAFQNAHFGRLILRGDDLVGYCLWRAGLTPGRLAEWDAMINGLRPGENTKAKLDEFQFSGNAKTPVPGGSPDEAAVGRHFIGKALNGK